MEFVARYAALVTEDGWPLSWAHFKIGQRNIARARARGKLDIFAAAVNARANPKDRQDWLYDQRIVAGVIGQ